jgi:hypothetical protein
MLGVAAALLAFGLGVLFPLGLFAMRLSRHARAAGGCAEMQPAYAVLHVPAPPPGRAAVGVPVRQAASVRAAGADEPRVPVARAVSGDASVPVARAVSTAGPSSAPVATAKHMH